MRRRLRNLDLIGIASAFAICLWINFQTSAAVEYGPSLASLTGVFVNWKGPDIWSLESGRKVKLVQYPGFSAVIPLITGDSQGTSEQIFQERGISTVGEFMVEAPPSYGLIAVIQELRLRKSNRDRGYNSSSCLDYIQFGELRNTGLGSVTGKICGTVHREDVSVKPSTLIGPRTFMSNGGKIRMAFNHAYVSELVDALLSGNNRKKPILRVEVAFTAFKTNCSEEWINGTVGDMELETYEACSDYTKNMNQTCISSKLLCDDILNCGGDADKLGSDDQQALCPDKPVRTTEKEPEEPEETSERPNPLNSLLNLGSTFYGTSGSSPPFQFERKFKPYVSPAESAFQQESPTRKGTANNSSGPGVVSSSPETGNPSSGVENVVRPIGSYSVGKTNGGDLIMEGAPKRVDMSHEDVNYGRRELADAINSVIYGVALFIVFTIFITLFVIYIGRRIQMNLSARNSRNGMSSGAPGVNSNLRPTTAVITRDTTTSCNTSQNRELAFSSSNTTVVLVTLPQAQNAETYDMPPSYDTLFPNPNSSRS